MACGFVQKRGTYLYNHLESAVLFLLSNSNEKSAKLDDLVVVHALQVVLVDPQVGQSRPGDELFRFEPQVDLELITDVRIAGMNHVSVCG